MFSCPRIEWSGHIVFVLSFCLFVCLLSHSLIMLNRRRLHIWHAYSTNDALSNDTKVNYLVIVTLIFVLKIAFPDFVVAGGIVFHKHMFLEIAILMKTEVVK